jgi:hypothetical protein
MVAWVPVERYDQLEKEAAMTTRRTFLGALAGSVAPAVALPVTAQEARTSESVQTILGALSAFEVIPASLHDDIRTQRPTPDLTPYLNEGIARVSATPGGGTLFLPQGAYSITELDLTQTKPSESGVSLIGAGRQQTILRALAPDRILVNALGRSNLTLRDFEIQSSAVVSQCGLLLGRHRQLPSSTRNRIENVRVRGAYSQAGCVSIAAESTTWVSCTFENSLPAHGHCCFVTAGDPGSVILRSPIALPVLGSNTDNFMTDCEFYATYDGACPLVFSGAAGYTMQGCTVMCGNASAARLVTYQSAKSIFNGPVTWLSPHFEVFGRDNIVHLLVGEPGVTFFRGVNNYGGNYQVADQTTLLGASPQSDDKPVLQTTTWTAPVVSGAARTLSFKAYGLADCTIGMRLGDGVGDVEITGFAENSRVYAAKLKVAQRVAGSSACL